MHVFITFLVGGGLLFSSIAWVVDRLASATTTPVGEQRLARAADVVGDIEPVGDGGRFRAVLTPTMVETNRRQFRGCLEDWLVDHIQIDVLSLEPRG